MLVLARVDLERAAARRRRRRGDVGRGAARHRPRVRRGPDRAAAAARAGRQRLRICGRCSPGRRSSPATAYGDPRVPGRVLAAVRAAGDRRGARRAGVRPRRRRRGAAVGDRQPDGAARRAGRVVRQLPRRAGRCWPATSWRSARRRSARSPSGAPTGCSTLLGRTACRAFLAAEPGVDSGMMIAQYTQAAMVAENRRLAAPASVDSLPTQRDAGGPRLDGVGRGAQAPARRGQPGADRRGRAVLRGAGAGPACAAARRPPERPRRLSVLRSRVPGPGPDRYLAPSWRRWRRWCVRARWSMRSRPRSARSGSVRQLGGGAGEWLGVSDAVGSPR